MATTKQKAIAAGFLHALQDPEVLKKWQEAKNNSLKLRTLIKDTLGLAELPSEDDLNAMRGHAEAALQEEHRKLTEACKDAPHVVGEGFMVQE